MLKKTMPTSSSTLSSPMVLCACYSLCVECLAVATFLWCLSAQLHHLSYIYTQFSRTLKKKSHNTVSSCSLEGLQATPPHRSTSTGKRQGVLSCLAFCHCMISCHQRGGLTNIIRGSRDFLQHAPPPHTLTHNPTHTPPTSPCSLLHLSQSVRGKGDTCYSCRGRWRYDHEMYGFHPTDPPHSYISRSSCTLVPSDTR